MIRKIPGMYLFIVGIILVIMITIVLWFTGLIQAEDFVTDILIIVIQWIFITGLALLGAIVLGMFLGIRILGIQGFTPFEKEMLMMRSEVSQVGARLDEIEKKLDKLAGSDEKASKRPPLSKKDR